MNNKYLKIFLFSALMFVTLSTSAFSFTESIYTDWFFLRDFHNYDYASVVDLERTWIGSSSYLPNSISWGHTLPDGFSVPPYNVDRAKLWIDAAYVGTNNNEVEIEGLVEWDALNHCWSDNTLYDLASIDQPGFWNDGVIDVSVLSGECSLRLDRAVLVMDYSSSGNVPTNVPEPATMILIGLGLAGIGIQTRRHKK